MNWFRKPLLLLVALSLGLHAPAARAAEKGKGSEKTAKKKPDKKGSDPKKKPVEGEPEGDKGAGRISVPIPPGHDARGLVIPHRDAAGKLQMRFTMEVGKRIDADHLEMTRLLIETFDEEGKEEMTVDLPQSVLDLNTRVVSTENSVLIKRSDFELTGRTMEFNTETRTGRVGGKVRMLIYNLEDETDTKAKSREN